MRMCKNRQLNNNLIIEKLGYKIKHRKKVYMKQQAFKLLGLKIALFNKYICHILTKTCTLCWYINCNNNSNESVKVFIHIMASNSVCSLRFIMSSNFIIIGLHCPLISCKKTEVLLVLTQYSILSSTYTTL